MAKRVSPLRKRFERYQHFPVDRLERRLAYLKAIRPSLLPRLIEEMQNLRSDEERVRLSKATDKEYVAEKRLLRRLIQGKTPK